MKNKTNFTASNREHVTEVAARLFLSRGYGYTSMDDVMRESQVSKSNIYYHFKSKEELLLSVVEFWIASYESILFQLLGQDQLTVEERIFAFLDRLITGVAERDCQGACPFITLYLQSPVNADQVKHRIARFFTEMHPLVRKLFEQGVRSREFRANLDPDAAARLFVASLEGSLVLAETMRDAKVIRETARQFCLMLH